MNKIVTLAVVSALGLGSATAMAKPRGEYVTVVSSTPIYETVSVPQQQCWMEPVTTYESRPVPAGYVSRPAIGPGTVIGAVLGGVIGHQVGGSNRAQNAATVAGAVIGGAVGNHVDRTNGVGYVAQPAYYNQQVAVTHSVQRCTTTAAVSQRIVGYDVRYVHHGRPFVARMPHAPAHGHMLRVGVDVFPGAGPVPARYGYGPVTPVYVR
ncbi:glycine zipper 2TM domain-containing protein [Usitatibacter palustris]|uniref:Glycine zipper 2TM domain-containing protein n=1 Tax=Usitatibacter palustris TaxID=2732487 RepID=A0A6M4H6D1_9PROT|nr:glycine zipper 2TM domain-containing protein [Usitatibacter palustris]QJR14745.1 hypothetical protein DSM104440_01555 [Usitatibacter palustris]